MGIIEQYYIAFNSEKYEEMINLLADDVIHEPSQGLPRKGREKFREFLKHMEECYKERVIDPAILYSADGKRGSAEFMLEGKYLKTDSGLPPAKGQPYRLRVGAFFEISGNKITRISNHYNLPDWINQVSK